MNPEDAPQDIYRTLADVAQGLYKEKGSKFLAFAYPVNSEDEVKAQLALLRKEFHDARHHCYAYLLDPELPVFRANDDGEPNNSAGIPILGQIRAFELCNVLVVVIRYFGGTKLGVGGLVQAYKTAAQQALEAGQPVEKAITRTLQVSYPYHLTSELTRILKTYQLEPIAQSFEMDCQMVLHIRKSVFSEVRQQIAAVPGIHVMP